MSKGKQDCLYVLCDAQSNVATISNVTLFGSKCAVAAIFLSEEEALHVLYELEKLGGVNNEVRRIERTLTTRRVPR